MISEPVTSTNVPPELLLKPASFFSKFSSPANVPPETEYPANEPTLSTPFAPTTMPFGEIKIALPL